MGHFFILTVAIATEDGTMVTSNEEIKENNMINIRKALTVSLITASLVACSPAQAGLWDSVATSGWSEKSTTAKYKLNVYGFDARVYEWQPKDNPNVRCVFVASNQSSGVSCYNIKDGKR